MKNVLTMIYKRVYLEFYLFQHLILLALFVLMSLIQFYFYKKYTPHTILTFVYILYLFFCYIIPVFSGFLLVFLFRKNMVNNYLIIFINIFYFISLLFFFIIIISIYYDFIYCLLTTSKLEMM